MTATTEDTAPICESCGQPQWGHTADGACLLPLVKASLNAEATPEQRLILQEWVTAATPQQYESLMQAACGVSATPVPANARDERTETIMERWKTAAGNAEMEPYRPSVLPGDHAWARMQEISTAVSTAVTLPPALRNKPADVLLLLLAGHDVGIAPTVALNKIHVIEGKPSMSAELMRALVLDRGHMIRPEIQTTERCVMVGRRANWPAEDAVRCDWTLERARGAKLADKDVWKKYPEAMLAARATSELCRLIFPDVLAGVSYTPEELGSEVDGDGAPLRIASTSTTTAPEPRWAIAGWSSFEEEKQAHDALVERIGALSDDQREVLRAQRAELGWPIQPREKFEAFEALVASMEPDADAPADVIDAEATEAEDAIEDAVIVAPEPSAKNCTSCGDKLPSHKAGCDQEPF